MKCRFIVSTSSLLLLTWLPGAYAQTIGVGGSAASTAPPPAEAPTPAAPTPPPAATPAVISTPPATAADSAAAATASPETVLRASDVATAPVKSVSAGDATDIDVTIGSELSFYEPPPGERFIVPPPPPPPKPRGPSLTVSAYTQSYTFFGSNVEGSAAEVGARLGLGSAVALELGYVPNNSLMAVGVQFNRFSGANLLHAPSYVLALLSPSVEIKAITDFGDNVFALANVAPIGVGFASCNPLPLFFQVRPQVAAWLPAIVAGDDENDHSHTTLEISWGISVEAGLLFF